MLTIEFSLTEGPTWLLYRILFNTKRNLGRWLGGRNWQKLQRDVRAMSEPNALLA